MVALLRIIIGPLVTALVEQIPNFIAAFQKWKQRSGADVVRAQDGDKIEQAIKDAAKQTPKP